MGERASEGQGQLFARRSRSRSGEGVGSWKLDVEVGSSVLPTYSANVIGTVTTTATGLSFSIVGS